MEGVMGGGAENVDGKFVQGGALVGFGPGGSPRSRSAADGKGDGRSDGRTPALAMTGAQEGESAFWQHDRTSLHDWEEEYARFLAKSLGLDLPPALVAEREPPADVPPGSGDDA